MPTVVRTGMEINRVPANLVAAVVDSMGPFPRNVRTATYGTLEYPCFTADLEKHQELSVTKDEITGQIIRKCIQTVPVDEYGTEHPVNLIVHADTESEYTTLAIPTRTDGKVQSVVCGRVTFDCRQVGLALTVRGTIDVEVYVVGAELLSFFVKHTRAVPATSRRAEIARRTLEGGYMLSLTSYTLSPKAMEVEAVKLGSGPSVVDRAVGYRMDFGFVGPGQIRRVVRFPNLRGQYARLTVQPNPFIVAVDVGGTYVVADGGLPGLIVPVSGKGTDCGITVAVFMDMGTTTTTAVLGALLATAEA